MPIIGGNSERKKRQLLPPRSPFICVPVEIELLTAFLSPAWRFLYGYWKLLAIKVSVRGKTNLEKRQ